MGERGREGDAVSEKDRKREKETERDTHTKRQRHRDKGDRHTGSQRSKEKKQLCSGVQRSSQPHCWTVFSLRNCPLGLDALGGISAINTGVSAPEGHKVTYCYSGDLYQPHICK